MTSTTSETTSCLLQRAALSLEQQNDMFQLLSDHFAGVNREQFGRDLQEKNWVILLERDGQMVGFSTLLAYESSFNGETVSVVYSGDTIMAREAWGSPVLAQTWIASVNQLRTQYPRGRYYWLLLTSGFRTYRFLPVFWREFYPRFNATTPASTKRLLDQLATERFGCQYDPVDGLVRFEKPQQLRGELVDVSDGRKLNPHIAFFLKQNSGHDLGDELVCLTELQESNLTAAGRRMVSARPHESHRAHC